MRLLLASKSETRQHMLTAAGIPFASAAARLDEEQAKATLVRDRVTPREIARRLAEMKAASVVDAGDALVLGADQVLERDDGSVMNKPSSRGEAADQLRALAGRVHHLHSAAVIVERASPVWTATETATLHMRPLTAAFLEAYLDVEYASVRWNVGAYRIEGPGVQLFQAIEGSHFAILGLPLLPLLGYLRERAVLPG